jgi:hypothetical protein
MKKTPEKLSQTLSQVSSNQEKSAVPDSKEISHKIEKSPFAASLGVVELELWWLVDLAKACKPCT